MDIRGKKINFLGDSITEGCGVTDPENVFVERLARDYGLAAARNYGIGGTRIARQTKPSADPVYDRDYVMRVDEMDADADIVIVFGGTNDFGHGDAPLGEMTDRTPYSFCGACHLLCERLIERFPGALIVFMTPLHRLNEDDRNGEGIGRACGPLKEYINIIKATTEYYAIPTLDLWSCSSLQPKVKTIQEKYCPDGLHPNDAGHKLLADRIAGFLSAL